ncbi:cupin domain-containing protein [Orenia marismortui]|uniref:Cupin type-2 domain-containing protein n=1 Tax=Orenia marismortui TaxID=46469 RepID=A0A4R8GSG3_9FIRM|nr:cupin domain-containing protein [Orenia marismortui]TDX46344.1 hypothetical protein C7959_14211 [Orenia marismortui]
MDDFIVPAKHFKFKAKKLSEKLEGSISDSSVAYIEPQGGGPKPSHTHEHDHFFIVVKGCATIEIGEEKLKVEEDQSVLVSGSEEHSVWNESDELLKMIGITIQA